jgi:hypothetical protein
MKLIRAVLAVLLEQLIQGESIQLHVASSCRLTPLPAKQVHFQKKLSAQTVPRGSLISKSNMFHGACVNVILFKPSLCQFL